MLRKDINPSMVKKEYQALVSLKKKSEVWFIPIMLEIISGKKRPKTPKPNHSNPKMKRKRKRMMTKIKTALPLWQNRQDSIHN